MRSNPVTQFLHLFAFLTAAIILCPTGALASERTLTNPPASALDDAPSVCATFVSCNNISVQLDASGQVSIHARDVYGGSDATCGIADTSVSPRSFTCAELGPNNVILTLEDTDGNIVTCNATVTVTDALAPVLSCPANINVSADAGTCGTVVNFNAPTATDNCGGSPAPTSLFGYTYLGTHNGHTYFISDVKRKGDDAIAGADTLNTVNGYFVTINDAAENTFLVGAISEDVLIGLNDKVTEGVFLWENGDAFTYSNWDIGEPNDNNGKEDDVALRKSDGLWNDIFTSSNGTTQKKFVVELEPSGAPISINQITGLSSGSNFPVGTHTITFEAMDAEGNSSQCSFDIMVTDNENPVAVCQSISLSLDGSGNASITAASINNGSSDNCGSPSLSIDLTSFDCNDIGANTVVLTATDGNGNTDTCHATVTVVDDELPTMTCPTDIVAYIDANQCHATISGSDPGAADNCSANLSYSITGATSGSDSGNVDGLQFDLGESTVTYALDDGNGNSHAGCSFTITVMPTDDAVSCSSCPSGPTYDVNLPDPVVIGSGLSNQHFAVSQYCGLNVGLRAHRRFLGDIVPSPGDTYSIETGESPTSGSDPTPVSGVAKWNYLASINLGTYTFNDLYVYLKLDFDASDSANQVGPYIADISQFMIGNSQGNTSLFQASENLGFSFWQGIGDPAILPFDPFAPGTYDLSVEVLSPDSVLVLQSAIVVNVFKPGCTDPFSSNYDPTATQDDASCIACAPASLTYNTTYPNPIVVGSGLNGQNMAVANYCSIDAGIRAHKRFLGYVTPVDGDVTEDTYPFGTGVSPTSGSSGVPDPGKARWDLFFAVDLGNFTFNDLDVFLDVDFDPSDGGGQNPPVIVNLSQVMIDTGLGNTSILQASENLGFDYWLAFAHPNMPFDPYAEGVYDLSLRIVAPGNVEVINIPIRVLVDCEFVEPSENLEPATLVCPSDITINNQMVIDPWQTGWATLSGGCDGNVTYSDYRGGLDQCNMTGFLVRTFYNADSSQSCNQIISITDTTAPWLGACPADITVSAPSPNCVASVNFESPMAHNVGYHEGFEDPNFESDASGNALYQGWNNYNSRLERVATGTAGITSSAGSAHGVIEFPLTPGFTGAFNRLGGYTSAFGDGFKIQTDVYIDLTDPAVSADTYAWDLSAAASKQNGDHLRDFIFHAASNASGKVLIAGSNNTNFARRNDLASLNHYEITTSGWYTFKWVFRESLGSLAVDLELYDASGTHLFTETRYTPGDDLATTVGGNRYLWFTFVATDYLAIDNTSLLRNLPVSCSASSGDLFPVGTTTLTCTAIDSCGNTTECSFDVTVEDNVAPTAVCKDTILYLDANGNASFAAEDLNNGSTDNCNAPLTFSASKTSFTCSDVGINTVILTVSDGNNTDTCWSTVTVEDTIKPNLSVSNITLQLNSLGSASITAGDVVSSSSDACGVAHISAFPTDFNCIDIGPNKVRVTAIDVNGNIAYDTATVTVEDDDAPYVVCQDITVQLDASGNASITAAEVDGGSFDHCGIDSIWVQPNSFTCADIGTPKTVVFTVMDVSGNQDSCNALVTVADDINPCAPTCVPLQIVALNLVSSPSGTTITPLSNGYIVNKAAISGNFSVEAITCSGPVGSVIFKLNGSKVRTESVAPYALKGDNPPGNFTPWKPAAGTYTITATPYSGPGGSGNMGIAYTVTITVVESGPPTDCNGVVGGSAFYNSCNICVGGNTGLTVNEGKDDCGICGGNNENKDCYGDCFGTAFIDNCGICSGGNTGNTPNSTCTVDCNGDINGTAFLDDCNICSEGLTGHTANSDKDTCGQCFGNNLSCATCQPLDVTDLVLVDASTGTDVASLTNGYVINKSSLPSFSVRADLCSGPAGSVLFRLNGNLIQTENIAPYTIAGDNNGTYKAWNIAPGTYNLEATAYSGGNGNGSPGGHYMVTITIVNSTPTADCNGVVGGSAFVNQCNECVGGTTGKPINLGKDDCAVCGGNNANKDCAGVCFGTASVDACGQCSGGTTGIAPNSTCTVDCNGDANGTAFYDNCNICSEGNSGHVANADRDSCGVCFGNGLSCANCTPNEVIALTLMNTGVGGPIRILNAQDTIFKNQLPQFSVRAEVCSDPDVESVRFFLNANNIQTESTAPYAIAGDNNGSFHPWNIAPGHYTLTATPYSGNGGTGTIGISETVDLWIMAAPASSIANNGSGQPDEKPANQKGLTDGSHSGNTENAAPLGGGKDFSSSIEGLALRLFPNPTTGALTVETENAAGDSELMLLDMSGKLLLVVTEVKTSGAHRIYSLDLAELPKGIYLVKLQSGSEIKTKRVIKE